MKGKQIQLRKKTVYFHIFLLIQNSVSEFSFVLLVIRYHANNFWYLLIIYVAVIHILY